MWSRYHCICDGIDRGSILPYLEVAKAHDYEVIVLNPNATCELRKVELQDKVEGKFYVIREGKNGENEYFDRFFVEKNESDFR